MRGGLASVVLGVAGLTLASRVVGFGRWLVFSQTVGATCLADAYNSANALPNVLFEIVAGGVLAGVVIPVVARHVSAGRTEQAGRTTSALLTWTLLILTVPGLGALFAGQAYATAFAQPGCSDSAGAIAALLVMFVPQIWLYGLAVVSAGVLQAHGRFLAAAMAPLLSSVVVIGAYLLFAVQVTRSGRTAEDATDLAPALAALGWGTSAGVLALALTTALPLARLGLPLRPRVRFAPGDTRVVATIALAGLVGLVLQQCSVLVINFAAQRIGTDGALTRYTWAYAVYLLPYAVLAAPLLQVAFPRLSGAAEQGPAALRTALAAVGPAVVVAGCLGGALLAATAIPVARVFVLGPGGGEAAALAEPIIALAPAVLGFALLGLASRTLLAQHHGRSAGITTASGWGAVIVAVAAALAVDRASVPVLAGAVSAGMVLGAAVGWVLVRRSTGSSLGPVLGRPLSIGLLAGGAAVAATIWFARAFGQATLPVAAVGAVGTALLATVVFLAVLRLVQPALLAELWALRRQPHGAAGR